MAHSKARVTDGKVTYPPGVKEISDKISKEEMVRRLKVSISFTLCCSHVSFVFSIIDYLKQMFLSTSIYNVSYIMIIDVF